MAVPQKIASQVRKVSQLSSALGLSRVKNYDPAIHPNYQILHTAVLRQDLEVIGQNKKNDEVVVSKAEGCDEQMPESCLPLPAKRWEQKVDLRSGVNLSEVGQWRSS